MAKRKGAPRFATLWDAVREGGVEDVLAVVAQAGGVPEEREEDGDPTPLMYAAARGRLDVVQALVEAGDDVDVVAWHGLDLDLPFLESLADTFSGMSALAHAAAHGQQAVVDYLAPRTSADLRREAEAIAAARAEHLRTLGDEDRTAFLKGRARPESAAAAARKALLAEHPKLSRWIVQCALCHKQGHRPTMPDEIDRRGTAARARKLFRPLALEDQICQRCRDRAEHGRRVATERARARRAERRSP